MDLFKRPLGGGVKKDRLCKSLREIMFIFNNNSLIFKIISVSEIATQT
jgi:hypothetical protein